MPDPTQNDPPQDKKSFGQTLVDVAKGLATLKVTTCVGEIKAKRPAAHAGLTKVELDWDPAKTQLMRSEIDLVAGNANRFHTPSNQ